jgi:2-C-methyl-D-erythritol 4-phosphate cytidylyltransferase
MNTAIIVAAGSGQRFGGDIPKQFIQIAGKPIIIHTIEKFQACRTVDAIVLVLSAEARQRFDGLAGLHRKYGLNKLARVVVGGLTRAESVLNALSVLDGQDDDLVAVHDGVRPCVTVKEVERTYERAVDVGAACLVGDVVDTIKAVEDEEIKGTIDRRTLRRALTPQVFRFELLTRAFEQKVNWADVTDECYLVERLGERIAAVDGSARNIKITRPEDVILAEAYLREEETASA